MDMETGTAAAGPVPLTAFQEQRIGVFLHLTPACLGDLHGGIRRKLDRLLFRFNRALKGVPCGYTHVQTVGRNGMIVGDKPTIHFKVRATLTLFRPEAGTRLHGVVNQVSVDHIGMLVHGIFNASISSASVKDSYEFDVEKDAWCDKNYDSPVIEVGTKVSFVVRSLETAKSVLAIHGDMLDDDSGPIFVKTAAKRLPSLVASHSKKGEAAEATAGAPATADSSGHSKCEGKKKKKRKREPTDSDGDEEAGNTTTSAAPAMAQADEATPTPTKAKKKARKSPAPPKPQAGGPQAKAGKATGSSSSKKKKKKRRE